MYSPKSAGLVVVCIVLLALPSVFIVLRFKVRMNTKAGIGAEEYTILGALVKIEDKITQAQLVLTIDRSYSMPQRPRRSTVPLTVASVIPRSISSHMQTRLQHMRRQAMLSICAICLRLRYLKLLFAGPLLFAVAIFLIKASTLILYRRIFVTRGFGIACHIVMGLCAGWFFASVFVSPFTRLQEFR